MATVKISIIGTGLVGATTAFTLVEAGLASELVLVDIDRPRAEGEAMDLSHGISFTQPARISAGSLEDCGDSRIIIFSAGVNQKPGETRLDLAGKNAAIIEEVIPVLKNVCPHAIYLIVTNPVDILTYAALKAGNLSPDRVIGSGTVLDSSRFRQALSEQTGIDARSIHAYIVGEHGDSEVPLWSRANIAGTRLEDIKGFSAINRTEIFGTVKNAAYHIIEKKGATYYAVALAIRRIIEAILGDQNSVLPVSSLLEGQYGLHDVCLSLPCIVNSSGRKMMPELPISREEEKALQQSAEKLKKTLKDLGLQ